MCPTMILNELSYINEQLLSTDTTVRSVSVVLLTTDY